MSASARELYERGTELGNRQRFAEADRVLRRADARTTDPDLRARIAGTRAFVLSQLGEQSRAERLCRETLARPGLSRQVRATVTGQWGTLLVHAGRYAEAEPLLDRALAVLDDPLASANLRMNRSLVRLDQRDFAAARADLRAAASAYAEGGEERSAAEARHNLGYAALLAGDLVSALDEMSHARRLLEHGSAATLAICDFDRALVLNEAGLTTEAERLLEDVAGRFGAARMARARGEAELHLARSLLVHDPRRAVGVAERARRRFDTLGLAAWRSRAAAVAVRARLRSSRSVTDADLDRVVASLRRMRAGEDAQAVRLDAARARVARGEAGVRVPSLASRAPLPLTLSAHEVRAARAFSAGDARAARRHAALGADLLDGRQRGYAALDLQASSARLGEGILRIGLTAAVSEGRADVVFEWSERARHLSQQVVALRPPPDEDLAADLADLRRLRVEEPTSLDGADPRVAELRERLRRRQWADSATGRLRPRTTLEHLCAALPSGSALLAYVFTGNELACVVADAAGATVVPVGPWERVRHAMAGLRADLDVSARVRSGPLAAVVQAGLRDRLAALSAALLAPVLRRVPDPAALVITAPGVLAGLPWTMLPAAHGRAITLAASATSWQDAAQAERRPLRRALLVSGPRVPRAQEEVHTAAAGWSDPRLLVGEAATVSAVVDGAAEADVLHIAAHGRHAVDNPLFSAVELADGPLFGYDIDRLPRVPGLVVLSACEVGRSGVRWGEESVGMTRGWLHAGADTVVASSAAVSDDLACELLAAFHGGLARGQEPAVALARAASDTGIHAPFQSHGLGFADPSGGDVSGHSFESL